MKAAKILAIIIIGYVGLVVVFESLIGVFQPQAGSTLVLTTFDADGTAHDRVVSRLDTDGGIYVAANHWPRAWYHRVLENPEVEITLNDGTRSERVAVPVSGAEHDRVEDAHSLGPVIRFLTGFPPRRFVRLDPR
jgi:hypothetical protein